MTPMICRKPFRYAGVELSVGDRFEASDHEVRILSAIEFAEVAPEDPPAPPAPVASRRVPEPDPDIAALREQYEGLYGKRPFMGWAADVLREKIAAFVPVEPEAAPDVEPVTEEPESIETDPVDLIDED